MSYLGKAKGLLTFGSIIQDSFPHKKDLGSAAQGEKEMLGNNFLPPFFSMFVPQSSQLGNIFRHISSVQFYTVYI